MWFGAVWMQYWPLPDVKTANPNADWVNIAIPGVDGTSTALGYMPGNVYKAVSASCKHPEAVMQIMNWYDEKIYGATADVTDLGGTDDKNASAENYNCPFIENPLNQDAIDYTNVTNAISTGDTSKLEPAEKVSYDNVLAYEKDKTDVSAWADWWTFTSPNSSYKHYFSELQPSQVQKNLWWAVPTTLMANSAATYRPMAEETIAKIVDGQAPVSSWDDFVTSWNSLAGDQILAQVKAAQK
jgi:putative aldouronate transport system substrate-binding protein